MVNLVIKKVDFPKRSIKSFVCRNTALSSSKQELFEKLWPIYRFFPEDDPKDDPIMVQLGSIDNNLQGIEGTPEGISEEPKILERPRVLEEPRILERPRVLEIGFGRGDSLFKMCQDFPEQDFIGVEVYRPGLVSLLSKLEHCPLSNLKLCLSDALDVLKKLPPASLDKVQIFFPDPWPKQRHHKRRIIQPAFIQQLSQHIKPMGILHLATDWEDYAKHMMRILSDNSDFLNMYGQGQFAPRPRERAMTKYEARGERLGHKTWDLIFQRSV